MLELSPGNRNALVERASCYLKVGKNESALQDAEESLKENKEFTKVILIQQKIASKTVFHYI